MVMMRNAHVAVYLGMIDQFQEHVTPFSYLYLFTKQKNGCHLSTLYIYQTNNQQRELYVIKESTYRYKEGSSAVVVDLFKKNSTN